MKKHVFLSLLLCLLALQGFSQTINGTLTVCAGSTTPLTDATTGYTWSSSNTAVATVNATTGVVTGITAGTAVITYSDAGPDVATVTVNALPAAISNVSSVLCLGATRTLTDATGGGTWSSTNTAVGTIGSTSGTMGGIDGGTTTISYTLATGCAATAVATVTPSVITGPNTVCPGSTINLTDATSGGTWVSSAGFVAGISTAGVVTGASAGTTTISYTVAGGCMAKMILTVNPLPSGIGGVHQVCMGATITISNFSAGGVWSSSNTGIATVIAGPATVTTVTPVSPGTITATYTLPTGCMATYIETVNALPAPISGITVVCAGGPATLPLSDATPGFATWTSSNTGVATVNGSGHVTGVSNGTTTITYTVSSTACLTTLVVTVISMPANITGTLTVCKNSTTTLADATTGGTWTSVPGVAGTVGSTSGIVTALAVGTTTVNYICFGAGCYVSAIVTVAAAVQVINGTKTVCQGSTTQLTDAATGGTWSSSNTAIGSVGTAGLVTGISGGTTTITYTMNPTCWATANVTVNPLPGTINGTLSLCTGYATTLTDAVAGGIWSSSNTGIATVGSGTGVVTGVSSGTATITYTNVCGFATSIVSVATAVSSISGTLSVCSGATITLSDAATGGTWSSSNTTVGTVGSTTGIVAGIASGTTTITYATSSTCWATATVSVTASPAPITGNTLICVGGSTILSDATLGGTWSSSGGVSEILIVHLDSVGFKPTGNGTTTITYSIGTGCDAILTLTIDPTPFTISGTPSICVGSVTTLTDGIGGGFWYIGADLSGSGSGSVDVSGNFTGISDGPVTIRYAAPCYAGPCGTELGYYGCYVEFVISVNALPSVASISGSSSVHLPGSITLSDATAGGVWSSGNTAVANVGTDGTVTAVGSGTATISYTVTDVNGCQGVATLPINVCPTCRIASNTTGIEPPPNIESELSITPNPNTGTFVVSGNIGQADNAKVKIEIVDMLGKVVYSDLALVQSGTINKSITLSSDITNGIYLIKVVDNNSSHLFRVSINR